MREEIENWWEQALVDIEYAEKNLKIKGYYLCIFLSQQGVEKALKALYIKRFEEFPKTHDLTIFAKKLELPSHLYENCDDLTNVYTETRYPDMSESIPAKKFTEIEAKEVIKWVKEKI